MVLSSLGHLPVEDEYGEEDEHEHAEEDGDGADHAGGAHLDARHLGVVVHDAVQQPRQRKTAEKERESAGIGLWNILDRFCGCFANDKKLRNADNRHIGLKR